MVQCYLIIGPAEVQRNLKKPLPGLYPTMQFKVGGYRAPPLPLHIQCPDYPFAQLVYDRLQPFFSDRNNWAPAPRTVVTNFTATAEFQLVADMVEERGELIWAVKQGSKAGVEAIASVDNSKRNAEGQIYQEAFAFRSFTEAVKCEMLNDVSRTHLHFYSPAKEPERSAALRRTLLDPAPVIVKAETPDKDLGNPDSALAPDPGSPLPSAPSTPRRKGTLSTPSTPATLRWGNVLFAPSIDVRVNSPSPATSPGPRSPTRVRASRGKEFGHRLLTAEGFSPRHISDFEDMLLTASSVDDFCSEIGSSGSPLDMLGAEKVAIFWDLYKAF
ncbi:hypothetical protein BDP27DRAFT_1427129 [Rhodocollybia butyracea]|uniref:Uncharacterized protein n=1 Tax=Rhodocollybia butyracea TaxID=206335 RepID=A0A9P5PGX0_9AGAR|nr:hypothetical protein BDP27DRAFT_1427129 [Rhodocollybia butyracea]